VFIAVESTGPGNVQLGGMGVDQVINDLLQALGRKDLKPRFPVDRSADLGRIIIENRHDLKPLLGEPAVAQ